VGHEGPRRRKRGGEKKEVIVKSTYENLMHFRESS
jgi:hypothetical protein